MKIVYAYLYCNLGGVSSVIKERMQADQNGEIEIHCVFSADANGADPLRRLGATVSIAPDYISEALRIAREVGADEVHLIDEARHLPMLYKGFEGRIVLEVHTSTPRLLDQINDETATYTDRIIVPSCWSRDAISARLSSASAREKIIVLPNIVPDLPTISDRRSKVDDASVPTVLWVGKVSNGKNWRDAMRIFAALRRTTPCRLWMVTGGGHLPNPSADLLSEATALGISSDLLWLHGIGRNDMARLYDDAAHSGGLLLVTSVAESFGLVLVEAMRCGLPVVSSSAGALPELISEGKNGFVFPIGSIDRPIELGRKILEGTSGLDRKTIIASVSNAYNPDVGWKAFRDALPSTTAPRSPTGLSDVEVTLLTDIGLRPRIAQWAMQAKTAT